MAPIGEAPDPEEEAGGEPDAEDGGTINDPLTRGDVEAPRAEFEGRKPE